MKILKTCNESIKPCSDESQQVCAKNWDLESYLPTLVALWLWTFHDFCQYLRIIKILEAWNFYSFQIDYTDQFIESFLWFTVIDE